MIDDELFALLDATLFPLGFTGEVGEEFRTPALDVLRYYRRTVQLHWLPLIGRAQGVVAVVRQPVDLAGTEAGCRGLLNRVSHGANTRFPPSWGLGFGSIGLTTLVLTPEPIKLEDDTALAAALQATSLRSRVVPLALVRLNLGQEAMSFQLATGPAGLFPEPVILADALTARFRRFVPTFEWE